MTSVPGLAEIERALTALPQQAAGWVRAAHRGAWREYRDRGTYPGLRHRLDHLTADEALHGVLSGANRSPYGFSARRRQIRWGTGTGRLAALGQVFQAARSSVGRLPAWQRTGRARAELLRRNARPRQIGGRIVTRLTLNFNALNAMGNKHGLRRVGTRTQTTTYPMTVYHDSVNRAGASTRLVTRTRTVPQYHRSERSYSQEWGWTEPERRWVRERADALLTERVRGAVWDKRGRLRDRYALAMGGTP